jgi:hypothetical protein
LVAVFAFAFFGADLDLAVVAFDFLTIWIN